MPCPSITIHPITREQWTDVEMQLRASHILVEHDTGTAYVGPADIQWLYDEPRETLTITCLKKPFLASCDRVNDKIRELFEKFLPTA